MNDTDRDLTAEDRCPECNAVLAPDATECPHCGAEFGFYCPECDNEIPGDVDVCPHCGTELAEGFEYEEGEAVAVVEEEGSGESTAERTENAGYARFCGGCGAPITQDDEECPQCGVDLCPDCGAPLGDEDLVCPECGAEFTFSCPECGADLPVDVDVCPECGTEFEDE